MRNFSIECLLAEVPECLRNIPHKVRHATGLEVKIKEQSDEFKKQNPTLAKAQATLDIDPDNDAITIWVLGDSITTGALVHELIHLRRYVLESVPKLFPMSSAEIRTGQTIHLIENDLEHLFIVPEEISICPTREDWWINEYKRVLPNARGQYMALYLHWVFLRTVLSKHTELAKECATYLHEFQDEKVVRCADYLRADIQSAMPDKQRMINILLQILNASFKSHIGIGWYTVAEGKLTVRQLADS